MALQLEEKKIVLSSATVVYSYCHTGAASTAIASVAQLKLAELLGHLQLFPVQQPLPMMTVWENLVVMTTVVVRASELMRHVA